MMYVVVCGRLPVTGYRVVFPISDISVFLRVCLVCCVVCCLGVMRSSCNLQYSTVGDIRCP